MYQTFVFHLLFYVFDPTAVGEMGDSLLGFLKWG